MVLALILYICSGVSEDDCDWRVLNFAAGDSHVVRIGGQCHLNSASSHYPATCEKNYDSYQDHHHHRQTSSGSWSRDDDEAWDDGGSNADQSYSSLSSSSARSRPSFDDDGSWTVLADLGHRGVDQYSDGYQEDQRTVRFSDVSYDEKSRRYGWRFDVPGDPYCLKYVRNYSYLLDNYHHIQERHI